MISIITPTLGNRPEYLLEAGCSLLAQTYKGIEWIIVMPDKKTRVEKVRRLLSANITDLTFILIADKTATRVSVARNIGIKASHGEYVAFLDDDDIKYPRFCEDMLREITPGSLGAVCPMKTMDEKGNIIGMHLVGPISHDEIWTSHRLFFANEFLLKKDALVELGMFDENLQTSEDYELMLALTKKGHLNYCSQQLCAYRQHPRSMSNISYFRGEPTHKSIHYYHNKYHRNFFCSRCGKEVLCSK